MSLVSAIQDLCTRIALEVKGKQNTLVSGTNIKTINGESVLGSGNIVISGSGGGNLFIQDEEPVSAGPFLWFQTNFNGGTTLWLEDGA